MEEYLAWGVLSGDRTFFQGIRRLPPGHWMELDLSSSRPAAPRITRYWDVPEASAGPVQPAGGTTGRAS